MVDLGLPGLGGSRELILRGGREMNPESWWGDRGDGGGRARSPWAERGSFSWEEAGAEALDL